MKKKQLIEKSLMLTGDYDLYHDFLGNHIKIIAENKELGKDDAEYKKLVKEAIGFYKQFCKEMEKIIDNEMLVKDIKFVIWMHEVICQSESYKKAVSVDEKTRDAFGKTLKEFYASQGIDIGGG